jgi:hypothetical protein
MFISSFGLNQKNQKDQGKTECPAGFAGPTHM